MSFLDSVIEWFFPNPILPQYIASDVIEDCLGASESQLPNEFLALLVAEHSSNVEIVDRTTIDDAYIITSYYVVPGTESGPTSASLKSMNVPVHGKVVGSFHSHPSGALRPSQEDLNMFQKHPVNIIAGPPFTMGSWRVFNPRGEPSTIDVVDIADNDLSGVWADEFDRL